MAYYCDDVLEDAVLDDGTAILLTTLTTESAPVTSDITEQATAVLFEVAPIFGDGWFIAPGDLFEVAGVAGYAIVSMQVQDDALESAVLDDALFPTVGGDFYETAVLDDLASSTTTTDIVDAAVLDDTTSNILTTTTLTEEIAVILGGVVQLYGDVVLETAVLDDLVTQQAQTHDVVLETAVLDDLAVGSATLSTTVDEGAVLNDSVLHSSQGHTDTTDPAYIQGYAILARSGVAWVSPAKDFAMSRYEGLLSAEVATADGVMFGVSEDGTYELTSDGYVESVVTTGITDFDDPQRRLDGSKRKHVMAVYAEGESVAAYNLRVTTSDNNGAPVERTYAYPYPNGEFTRNTRCILGKLMWARRWQFAFVNSEPHTLREARALVEYTARRV